MVNKIIQTAHELIKQKITYLTFQDNLKKDESFNSDEKKKIRFFVNQILARYYRHLYILDFYFDPFLNEKTIITLTLYAVEEKYKELGLSYVDVLGYLNPSDQMRVEEFLKPHYFPLRIPEEIISKDKNLSLAIRFSVPIHLIELLQKDIGKKNVINFLAKFYRDNEGVVNLKDEEVDEFFTANKDFVMGITANTFVYEGASKIKDTPQYKDGKVIIASRSLQEISDEISRLPIKKILFHQFEESVLILLLALKLKDRELTYFTNKPKSRFVMQHLVDKFSLKNVKIVQKITQTYDLVVTTITSSNINGDLKHRDFYIRLPEDLSEFTARAKEEISGELNYVNEQGYYMFITKTVVRQETHYQTLNLLNVQSNLALLKEKQFFHFNDGHESLYYALFKKEIKQEE